MDMFIWYCFVSFLLPHCNAVVRDVALTLEAFRSWHNMELRDRLKYLLVESDWLELESEMRTMRDSTYHDDVIVTRASFERSMEDFKDSKGISSFWRECDANNDDTLDILEYACCRGARDQHGNIFDKNEYDFREEIILRDFADKLQRGDNLPDVYTYDENGIIID